MAKKNPYFAPTARRPRAASFSAAAGAAPGLSVRGMEVVQSIQAIDNSVRLIADKTTIVRVYLDPAGLSAATLVSAELVWRRGSEAMHYQPAMNRVRLTPATPPTLQQQRFDMDLSVNFRLPSEAVGAGNLEIGINRVFVPGGADVAFADPGHVTVRFDGAPVLRVRVIGLRYKSVANPLGTVTPDALHFAYLKSYLERAYPVAAVEWSQIVVDADLLRPPFGGGASNLANMQLVALRSRETSAGIDPRTHYYGLVDNEGGLRDSFMRGSAIADSQVLVFGMVASGPAGVPNGWSGDTDASFADWYGAHELGHTYQRRHPGFPPADQDRDPLETGFPYPEGLITTTPDNRFAGLDVGDAALGLPMRVLPGNTHHDVMTYAPRQWLSAYTYEGIYTRLVAEDRDLAPQLM